MSARPTIAERSATGAVRAPIAGNRWHFQHGPIDLVLEAWGDADECARAYEQAWKRFETVLPELVSELPLLKSPLSLGERGLGVRGSKRGVRPMAPRRAARALERGHFVGGEPRRHHLFASNTVFAAPHPLPPLPQGEGEVARRMIQACAPLAEVFITPMAAVAGAVADEIVAAMTRGRDLRKAYVNNGGDIALHLAPGERFETGIVGDLSKPKITARASLAAEDDVRGVATSGWRGRSFSLGIADSVTVLARDAAAADAAATLIANAVNAEHPGIVRRPARELDLDSDLGEHPVTVEVGALDARTVARALAGGEGAAEAYRAAGHIVAAYIELGGCRVAVGGAARRAPASRRELAWSLRA